MAIPVRSLAAELADRVATLVRAVAAARRSSVQLGPVRGYQPIPGGALVIARGGVCRIEFLRDIGVRLRYGRGPDEVLLCSNATVPDPPALDEPRIEETADELRLTGKLVRVTVKKSLLGISVSDTAGRELLRECEGAQVGDPDRGLRLAHYLTDLPGSRYFGLGEQTAPFERTGRRFALWNTDRFPYGADGRPIYASFPNYLVLRNGFAHGVFYDNPHRCDFDFRAAGRGRITWQADGGELRCYVLPGPRPADVLERYTRLTGRMPLPPRWSLGYHQSRWSYYPARELYRLADEFRRRRIPCDCLHLDIHYMHGYRVFTWHPERFPDPARLISHLENDGFKVTAIVDPGVKVDQDYEVYTAGRARDVFVRWHQGHEYVGRVWPGRVMFPDFSCPETREWWAEMHHVLLDAGVRGIWNDMNEPSVFSLRRTMPDKLRFRNEGRGCGHDELHNQYGLLMARATWEGARRLRRERRPFVLTRSGFAGVQRYAAMWTGDNSATWSHLRLSIPMLLGLGVSGVPFVGADIGGFFGSPEAELYTRFLQLGVLMPFCRTHSYFRSRSREPWCFGAAHEQANRELIELRYRLLPHLYTAFRQHARDGRPVMRPLLWENPDDEAALDIADEFYLGDHLLAAPVVHPGHDARTLYLPSGHWHRLGTDQSYAGGRWVTVTAPRIDPLVPRAGAGLAGLPLFVRGGAVVAMQEVQQYVGERGLEQIELHVWDGGSMQSELYEDAGDGYDYESGAWRLTRFDVQDTRETLDVRLDTVGDPRSGVERFRMIVHGLACPPSQVRVDDEPRPVEWRDGALAVTLEAGSGEVQVVRRSQERQSGDPAGEYRNSLAGAGKTERSSGR